MSVDEVEYKLYQELCKKENINNNIPIKEFIHNKIKNKVNLKSEQEIVDQITRLTEQLVEIRQKNNELESENREKIKETLSIILQPNIRRDNSRALLTFDRVKWILNEYSKKFSMPVQQVHAYMVHSINEIYTEPDELQEMLDHMSNLEEGPYNV